MLKNQKNLKKEFGKRIRLLRKTRGMTQTQLAEKAGIHSSFLSSVERGIMNASLESIVAIAKALEVHPGKLFPGVELDKKHEQLIDWYEKNRNQRLEDLIEKLIP